LYVCKQYVTVTADADTTSPPPTTTTSSSSDDDNDNNYNYVLIGQLTLALCPHTYKFILVYSV